MKRFVVMGIVVLGAVGRMQAQTSLDVLESDLKEAKEQHETSASTLMTTFLSTLETASESPTAALDLYKKAGGSLPDAAPVHSLYAYETPTEKAKREALDASNLATEGIVIQVHCGLMRNAALLAVTPKADGVQQQWLDWLKSAAALYPQMPGKRALKEVTMKDSVVSSYLGFHGWGDSAQGKWTISQLPQLYHDLVLQPQRNPPGPGTIDAWNTYIAMKQADEPDADKWAQEAPALDFDRDEDDFDLQPSMDKLAALDALIKANPTDDHLDSWITRMQAMIDTYRQHGATRGSVLPGATPGTPSSDATGDQPAASPGTPSSGTVTPLPSATPGTPSAGTTGTVPSATPGTAQ